MKGTVSDSVDHNYGGVPLHSCLGSAAGSPQHLWDVRICSTQHSLTQSAHKVVCLASLAYLQALPSLAEVLGHGLATDMSIPERASSSDIETGRAYTIMVALASRPTSRETAM